MVVCGFGGCWCLFLWVVGWFVLGLCGLSQCLWESCSEWGLRARSGWEMASREAYVTFFGNRDKSYFRTGKKDYGVRRGGQTHVRVIPSFVGGNRNVHEQRRSRRIGGLGKSHGHGPSRRPQHFLHEVLLVLRHVDLVYGDNDPPPLNDGRRLTI